ncbi:hypothetical protein PMAYCL1PPCAC_33048, partial [Pristionchus mayeri]
QTSIGITLSSWSLAILCLRELKNHVSVISQRTRSIQQKLIKNFIIQTVFPVALLGSPLIIFIGSVAY